MTSVSPLATAFGAAPALDDRHQHMIHVVPLTASIGAELRNVRLAEASRCDVLFGQIKDLLLEHKVLFFRDQDLSRAQHVALAEKFGPLEDHPVAGSDPEHP